ncbi:MAG: hypothetical protein A2W91_19415 [Bacteroidetes bacterium GWF2_38_335]|nr:MAG: hypothetical protein A2W91_19415 [Bacteroidetes bacterium GWF2_38_335]OFY79928.1 MAG: hypothetical protein A2281_10815 [Bacteroidetes bacterium RIFOXYA12_FULL_38_20]HBS86385.1 alpha-L-fucosidase [Bacteroidales bacterium]
MANFLSLFLSVSFVIGMVNGSKSQNDTFPAMPTPEQVLWQDMELSMFVHFAPNTWEGTETDNRVTPLARINPEKLDVNQWIDAAESFGAKMIIFVAKHAGGFCMWQTETTDYSIKNTPYKNGKGDILDEIAKACFERGMKLGIYIYPGDDTWGAYAGGGGRTKDPTKQEAYNKVLRMQWEEVLSRYGKQISEIWYDGGLVVPLEDIVKKYAPDAIVFQGPFASIRWVGNEQGFAPYPAWNGVKTEDAKTGIATADHGNPDGKSWLPLEVDVPLKDHNWFWSPTNSKNLRNAGQLMDMYYKSVGRGAVLLLNSAPDTTGLIPAEDMAIYKEFGEEIKKRFLNCIATTEEKGEVITTEFAAKTMADHVVICEDIIFGERVREYVVEYRSGGQWLEISRGTSIGHKRIEKFDPVEAEAVRVRFLKYSYLPVIRELSVYYSGITDESNQLTADKKDVLVASQTITKTGKFEIDLTGYIKKAGQYKVIAKSNGKAMTFDEVAVFLHGVETPGFAAAKDDGSCNLNITAHPTGEKSSIILKGKLNLGKVNGEFKMDFYIQHN